MNPIATLLMSNGSKITIELLPDVALNTVNSFVFAAQNGIYNQHVIERIVPGNWIDVSYTAFRNAKAKYLIPYEFKLHPEVEALQPNAGYVCMGGYGELGLSGCEFFFPLRECPELKGIYPVFGRVINGMDELYRIEKVKTRPITNFPYKDVEINEPIEDEIIQNVEVELKGFKCDEPIRVLKKELPKCWA